MRKLSRLLPLFQIAQSILKHKFPSVHKPLYLSPRATYNRKKCCFTWRCHRKQLSGVTEKGSKLVGLMMTMMMMMITIIFRHHFLFFFCFNFINIHYHTQKQKKDKNTWDKKLTTTFTIKSVKNQLRATRGAHNPNLQVVITHASHVYIMPAFSWTSTKNEWNSQNAFWSSAFRPSTPRKLFTRVLTILRKSTAWEQKRLTAFGPPVFVARTP